MSIIKKLFGDTSTRAIASVAPIVKKINDLEADIKLLSDANLKAKTAEFRENKVR